MYLCTEINANICFLILLNDVIFSTKALKNKVFLISANRLLHYFILIRKAGGREQ